MRMFFVLLLVLPWPVLAQMADPTRPPAAWLSPESEAEGAAATGGPRLQSVLLRDGGKPVAIISGKTLALGDEFEGSKLVRINEQFVVLRGAEGLTQLYLTPDVEKKMTETPRATVPKAGRKKEMP